MPSPWRLSARPRNVSWRALEIFRDSAWSKSPVTPVTGVLWDESFIFPLAPIIPLHHSRVVSQGLVEVSRSLSNSSQRHSSMHWVRGWTCLVRRSASLRCALWHSVILKCCSLLYIYILYIYMCWFLHLLFVSLRLSTRNCRDTTKSAFVPVTPHTNLESKWANLECVCFPAHAIRSCKSWECLRQSTI